MPLTIDPSEIGAVLDGRPHLTFYEFNCLNF
jgi:hypothetical protein